ncbi:MAG: hypothetical protein CBC74_001175 [Crocinitomicaceae bacterium TMED114]|nr:MAG: hypothetical protein CBC74_001175 [Crocinitomicaceae bacterium TMED114]
MINTCIARLSSATLILVCSLTALADTTTVQTYTFDAQNNPETAYDSPGRRWFEFPASDNGVEYGKVLMEYTLKCFEDGTAGNLGYACGEWDYLSYTYLFDHTGMLDSAALQHPYRLLADAPFESADLLPYTEGVQDSIWMPAAQHIVDAVNSEVTVQPGEVGYIEGLFATATSRRAQYLWTAEELAPLGAGAIDRLWIPMMAGAADARRMDLKWGLTSDTVLTGFRELSNTAYHYGLSSWQFDDSLSLRLSPPIDWDGEGNLILEFALDDVDVDTDGNQDGWVLTNHAEGPGWTSTGEDGEVVLMAPDRIEVDVDDLGGLSQEITIECWVYGDPDSQPQNGTLFEGLNANNQRVVNVHLPWGNGRVYWDCGWDGGYDRIDAQAATQDYEGQWNHWAFVKNAATGVMEMYLNGVLFHSATNKDNPIEDIVRMNLGCSGSGTNHYNGRVDDFRIWSKALDGETIAEWMNHQPTAFHPDWDDLLVDYHFDGANGTEEVNHNPGGAPGFHHGTTLRRTTPGRERFKGDETMFRPHIGFGRGDYLELVADGAILDLQPVAPMSLSTWEVQGNAVAMTDLTYHYAPGETVAVPLFGDTIPHPLPGEVTEVVNDTLDYFGVPFEVIDRYELYRYITPYGIGLDLGDDGWTWWYDVTDYLPLLRDSVQLEAGNWQELLDLKFHFIEGEPTRDVLGVEAFWKGQYGLSTFDQNVVAYEYAPGEGEAMWRLKTRASGHGFGSGNNCAEFCPNIHKVKVNGEQHWSWQIMQECADNALFPQGGTWIYDRAGWCPGAPTETRDMELTPLVEGNDSFTVDYDIDDDPDGNYRFEGQIIAYGPANHSLDAELVEVIAPNGSKLSSRTNPICDKPQVVLRNSGSTPLTSCTITFGVEGNLQSTTWTGELGFLEEEIVDLVALDANLWVGDEDEDLVFIARVSAANGGTDEVAWNDEVRSTFRRPPTYTYMDGPDDEDDNRLIVFVRTNSTPWENSAKLTHQDGTVYFQRTYPEANTQYRDTIYMNEGCYTFEFFDSDDDGISFWANNDGSGFVRLRKVGGNFITFEPDFGKSIVHNFHFETNLVNDIEAPDVTDVTEVRVYPNPAREAVTFELEGWNGAFTWSLLDGAGREVQSGRGHARPDARYQGSIPLAGLPAGVHLLVLQQGDWTVRRRVVVF